MALSPTTNRLPSNDRIIARTFILCTEKVMALPQLPVELLEIIFGMNDMVFTDGRAIQHYESLYPNHNIKWEDLDYSPLELHRKAQEICSEKGHLLRYIQRLLLGIHEYNKDSYHDTETELMYTPMKILRSFIRSDRYSYICSRECQIFSEYSATFLYPVLLARRMDQDLFDYFDTISIVRDDVYYTLKSIILKKRFDILEHFYLYLSDLVNSNCLDLGDLNFGRNIKYINNIETLEIVYQNYVSVFGIECIDDLYFDILHNVTVDFLYNTTNNTPDFLISIVEWLYQKGYRPTLDTYRGIVRRYTLSDVPESRIFEHEKKFVETFINRI